MLEVNPLRNRVHDHRPRQITNHDCVRCDSDASFLYKSRSSCICCHTPPFDSQVCKARGIDMRAHLYKHTFLIPKYIQQLGRPGSTILCILMYPSYGSQLAFINELGAGNVPSSYLQTPRLEGRMYMLWMVVPGWWWRWRSLPSRVTLPN